MSGWLGCCDCLQRRAMGPARRHGTGPPAPPPPTHQHGHHNAAFLGDEEADPAPPLPDQWLRDTSDSPDAEQWSFPSTSPPAEERERYNVVRQPIRPQFREICDLRDDRGASRPRRSVSSGKTRAGRPASPRGLSAWLNCGGPEERAPPAVGSGPFLPQARDAEWPSEELVVLDPQRRVSQLDNIPETSETNVTNETSVDGETRETKDERAAETGRKRPSQDSGIVSPAVTFESDIAAGPSSPPQASPQRPPARMRAASLGTPRRLTFPKFRRRSSQRRQSADAAGGGGSRSERSREPSRERSWLRRLSRGRPSAALPADQPPEQPSEVPAAPSRAARRWGMLRSNFDLDAPLTEHWGFLESVVTEFEKVDAKTYTEHLHEQSPLSSSSSEEEVPDALEAQLLLKLAQSEMIRPRRQSVSRRCVHNELQKRRQERHASFAEGSKGADEDDGEIRKDTDGRKEAENHELPAASDSPPVRPESAPEGIVSIPPESPAPEETTESTEPIAEEPSVSPSVPPPSRGADSSGGGRVSPTRRASSCPPPQEIKAAPGASRQKRGSIFSRLLALPSGYGRRPSLPPDQSEGEGVHHPTWFQRTAGPEAAAGPTSDSHALSKRRATVAEVSSREATIAEVSLREFLHEVDERAQHLRDEEFCSEDPYQVLAPEQRAADDDHVVPLLNTARCVDLMLADAERHLQIEYASSPAPSARPSKCPSPRESKCPSPRPTASPRPSQCQTPQVSQCQTSTVQCVGKREGYAQNGDGGSPAGSAGSGTSDGQVASGSSANRTPGAQTNGSGAGTPDKPTASSSGGRSPDKQTSGSRAGTPDNQTAGNSRAETPDQQINSTSCCQENGHAAGMSCTDAAQSQAAELTPPGDEPADTPPGQPENGPRSPSPDGPHVCSGPVPSGVCRPSVSAPAGTARLGRFPAYLSSIQHEMASAAESLRAKLQATLGTSHDSEPATSRSSSPPKSARRRSTSRGSKSGRSTVDIAQTPPGEIAGLPSATPTPRNSIAHPSPATPTPTDSISHPSQATPTPRNSVSYPSQECAESVGAGRAGPLALIGYRQMALALARQSTVGYQELALALARQGSASATSAQASAGVQATRGSAAQCQAVQTSPGLATPVGGPEGVASGTVAGQSRSAQTSPGASTPTDAGAGCDQCVCAHGASPDRATDVPDASSSTSGAPADARCGSTCPRDGTCNSGGTSDRHCQPSCPKHGSCAHGAPSSTQGAPSDILATPSDTQSAPSEIQCAPSCPRHGSCTQAPPSNTQSAPSPSQCATSCPRHGSCTPGAAPCSHCDEYPGSGLESSPCSAPATSASCYAASSDAAAASSATATAAAATAAAPLQDPDAEEATRSPGGTAWTVPVAEDSTPPEPSAPPARLLAYGQPSWVARQQQSAAEAAELRRRLDSGQRAASRRRDSLLRRRAERAAELAAPADRHGGDHERADTPSRPGWR